MVTQQADERLEAGRSARRQPKRALKAAVQTWDRPVRRALTHLAQLLWPNRKQWGLIPRHAYRLRQKSQPGAHTWWIEHDLPPADRFRCAAYFVRLEVDAQGHPHLTVESGAGSQPVEPLTVERLGQVVAGRGQTPACVIPRRMGPAHD